tara:strand:- start:8 stop:340 length:333 start_codon:yes stop_codon:yes gene_type:complete
MYKPLPDNVTIKKSDIHGLGLFAVEDISAGYEFGITHYTDIHPLPVPAIRTPLGGFYNHSENPNCETYVIHHPRVCGCLHARVLRAIKDIKAGEEITAKYFLYNPIGEAE